jgi:hypothetical protein
MSTELIIVLVAAFGVIPTIILLIYNRYAKGQRIQKQRAQLENVKSLLQDGETVKVALWINIERVNGIEYSDEFEYSTKLKNGLLNPHPVSVALFKPGEYRLTVSSNSREEYQGIEMLVTMAAGTVYQLGCNDGGPYFVVDPDPARYEYRE